MSKEIARHVMVVLNSECRYYCETRNRVYELERGFATHRIAKNNMLIGDATKEELIQLGNASDPKRIIFKLDSLIRDKDRNIVGRLIWQEGFDPKGKELLESKTMDFQIVPSFVKISSSSVKDFKGKPNTPLINISGFDIILGPKR